MQAPHVIFVGDLQILTVELARFLKKDIDLLVDLRESWCYLIKESHNLSLDDLKHLSSKGEDMKVAAEHLIKLSQDESLRALEEARQKAEWTRIGIFEQGKTEGREEGIEKGREQLVLNMLRKNMDLCLISELSGWTEKKILKLKDKT